MPPFRTTTADLGRVIASPINAAVVNNTNASTVPSSEAFIPASNGAPDLSSSDWEASFSFGGANAAILSMAGTDAAAETFSVYVGYLSPILDSSNELAGYAQTGAFDLSVTLSAGTVGASFAALFDGISSGDRPAAIVQNGTVAVTTYGGRVMTNATGTSFGGCYMPRNGATHAVIQTTRGASAATASVFYTLLSDAGSV